jgi:diguanylate cyclase (GGDEF)-like protein
VGTHGPRPGGLTPALIAAAVIVAALVALIVQADGPAALVDEAKDALWWLGAAVAGGAIALAAWWLERRRAPVLVEAARAAERERVGVELAQARSELAHARSEIERNEASVAELRDRAARFSRRDERERGANRELRRKVAELQHERGSLGEWGDVRTLVLRMALTIVEAERGMLLTRPRDGGDRLEVAAHEGFGDAPGETEEAKRFGAEGLEQDQILREDELVAVPIYVRDELTGVVVCVDRDGGFEDLDDDVLLALGDHAGAALQNTRLHDELRRSYVSTIRVLAEAIQAKDPFLRGHSEEVSDYVAAVARRLGLDSRLREQLAIGSLLHDLGKIGISERILHKPARLTPEEFAIIQLHPRIGYKLIEQVPSLRAVAPAILHHHERYDGNGYPSGLKGEQIPLEARIVCVADAFSAMTADRPYRARMPLQAACEELERHAGTQFDPEIARIFIEEVRRHPGHGDDLVADALDDAELQAHREPDEPVLGAGAIALTDSLTLLYGHRYLHEATAAQVESARLQDETFAVVLVHADEVERMNALDGYAAGDAHLRTCARSLSRLAVRLGATACREGGLTLALLCPVGAPADPFALAEQTRETLADCGALRVAVETWRPGESGDALLARARAAVQAAGEPSL